MLIGFIQSFRIACWLGERASDKTACWLRHGSPHGACRVQKRISAFILGPNIGMASNGMEICMERVGRICPWALSDSYHSDHSPDRYLHYLDYNVGIEKAFREVLCSVVISLRCYGCIC